MVIELLSSSSNVLRFFVQNMFQTDLLRHLFYKFDEVIPFKLGQKSEKWAKKEVCILIFFSFRGNGHHFGGVASN